LYRKTSWRCQVCFSAQVRIFLQLVGGFPSIEVFKSGFPLRFLVYALAGPLLLDDSNRKQGGIIGLEKLQESIATPTEADTALTNHSQTPRLSLIRPEQTELDLQELANIIQSEDGILTP
jgi:hypothetical protein